MLKRLFLSCFILGAFISCNTTERKIQKIVNYWTGKEIVFSDTLAMKIFGKDTCTDHLSLHQYKILNYIDTTGCSECQLKFYEWKKLQDEIDSLQADVSIVYVIFAKHYKPIELSQKVNKFNIPILYDSLGIMERKNNFAFSPQYKTFLLDSANRVIGIGNPVTNAQIWELYKKKIMEEK